MDLLFDFDKPAMGNDLLGRTEEINSLIDTITDKRKGAVIYDAPKSGKNTLVCNALSRLKARRYDFALCKIDLFRVRSYADFLACFREAVTKCFNEVNRNSLLPFSIDFRNLPEEKILEVPQLIAEESGRKLIIYIKEFQNVLTIEEPGFSIDSLDKLWSKQTDVRYIITGSFVNMMKAIFEDRKLFYYMVNPVTLKPIARQTIVDYIVSTCLNVGRVINQDVAEEIYRISGGSMWYVKQLCSFCYAFPAGYITDLVVEQAEAALIHNNRPRFMQIMLDLTPNQINFLKAVLDGVQRFSSQEVLDTYKLNSSANVFRLKDALKKKEVITFDKDDTARILDPLFEYWLRNYYFIK
ncbi:MAG: hypothetical protein IJT26_06730 [Bacteroidales bacterium]|nr:hypothetical protein [Bacteroidales bacterium]